MTITYQLYTAPAESLELKIHAEELQRMINTAFEHQDRSSFDKDPFAKDIFSMPQAVTEGWGTHGFLVVAYDDSVCDLPRGLPVATAGARIWAGRALIVYEAFNAGKIEELAQRPADLSNWELCLVTSRFDPKYRGQGIASKCISMVEDYVRSRAPVGETRLWVTALAGVRNIEFYQRKGYVLDGKLDDAPAGMWEASCPFQVGTLFKSL